VKQRQGIIYTKTTDEKTYNEEAAGTKIQKEDRIG
jgi:hypothetical protein